MTEQHKYSCPCCGYLTLDEPAGCYDICDICGWEDDNLQRGDPDYFGGANGDSLRQAQQEFLATHDIMAEDTPRDTQWQPLPAKADVTALAHNGDVKAASTAPAATETSHFFLGKVTDLAEYEAFIAEQYDDDDTPLSEFCASQGKMFIDHDFMELGFREDGETLAQFFAQYSYAEHWAGALCQRAESQQLTDANALLFVTDSEIAEPRFVSASGFALHYMGKLSYPI